MSIVGEHGTRNPQGQPVEVISIQGPLKWIMSIFVSVISAGIIATIAGLIAVQSDVKEMRGYNQAKFESIEARVNQLQETQRNEIPAVEQRLNDRMDRLESGRR